MSVLEEVTQLQQVQPTTQEATQTNLYPPAEDFANEDKMMSDAVARAGQKAMSLKEVIDVGVTGKALQNDEVLQELTTKKEQELKEDALAKVIASEAQRIKMETDRLTEQGHQQLAALQNEINQVRAEKEKLEKEADKCQAYFNSHKSVLKYAGCKEPMSLHYMQVMSVIGIIIMCAVKTLFSPLILSGLFIEVLVDIIGGVTGAIKMVAWKIVVTILLFLFIATVVILCYFGLVRFVF